MTTDNETLLIAILNQLQVNKIDYSVLARDIGAVSKDAAYMRWQRYRKKLNLTASKPARVQKTTTSPAKRGKKSGKNIVKIEGSEESSIRDENTLVTPVRRLPGRKARVVQFKEDTTDDDDGEGQEQEDEVKIEHSGNDEVEGDFDGETFWA